MWATVIAVPIFLGEADPVAGGRALSGGPKTTTVPGGLIPEPLLEAVFRIGPFHRVCEVCHRRPPTGVRLRGVPCCGLRTDTSAHRHPDRRVARAGTVSGLARASRPQQSMPVFQKLPYALPGTTFFCYLQVSKMLI